MTPKMDSQYENLLDQYENKLSGYYENPRLEMLPFIPEGISSLLEVGCSSAAFSGAVKERFPDCEVWGIEPNPEAASRAEGRIDRIICGTFSRNTSELEGKRFDCIVFNDVLEHLVDPNSALYASMDHLSESGKIVASIPNVLHFYNITKILVEQDWKYESEGIMDNTHLRFFTKKSILRMFEESGYTVERIEGINASFGLKYKLANALFVGRLADWRFIQFAVVASRPVGASKL